MIERMTGLNKPLQNWEKTAIEIEFWGGSESASRDHECVAKWHKRVNAFNN